ncbi:MAG: hypothetical protein INR73_21520 [Williamsia sp.]|nr:hypothetical protein [Williamsia sp.]
MNSVWNGFYSALPARYQEGAKKYPLLIWIHGNGQVGNGRADLPRVTASDPNCREGGLNMYEWMLQYHR